MKNFHRLTAQILIGGVILITLPMILPAETLSQVLNGQNERTLIAQESQQRVEKVAEQTRKMEDKYRAELKEINGLEIYNQLLELQIENQARVKTDLEKSILAASQINRQIVPVMTKMIESLDQFVQLDVPFLMEERTKRVDFLNELMQREDVTVAEKFRKVTEAYQIENDYGKTIETYKDTQDVDGKTLELDFLRIGRIAFLAQSVDGQVSRVWNQKSRSWQDASDNRNEIKAGLRIAKKQVAPDLIILPVDSAEAIETKVQPITQSEAAQETEAPTDTQSEETSETEVQPITQSEAAQETEAPTDAQSEETSETEVQPITQSEAAQETEAPTDAQSEETS